MIPDVGEHKPQHPCLVGTRHCFVRRIEATYRQEGTRSQIDHRMLHSPVTRSSSVSDGDDVEEETRMLLRGFGLPSYLARLERTSCPLKPI